MNFIKKIIAQAALIVLASIVVGVALNFSLVKRYFRGEFQQAYLSEEEQDAITFIQLGEAEDYFLQGEALFVDSRSQEKFREGRILGAVNIPFEGKVDQDALQLPEMPPDKLVVIYCDGDECRSSINLARFLLEKGFKGFKIFFGGWEAWKREGLPTENDS